LFSSATNPTIKKCKNITTNIGKQLTITNSANSVLNMLLKIFNA